jgi:hypothetical protein
MKRYRHILFTGLICLLLTTPLFATNYRVTKPQPGTQPDSSYFLHKGLVGYLPFFEGAGSQAQDMSSNNNYGTLSGATWVEGGLEFNGSSAYVEIADSPTVSPTAAITLICSVYPHTITANDELISKDNHPTHNNAAYFLDTNAAGNTIRFGITPNGDYSSYNIVTSATVLSLNEWTHIAATFDGTTLKLYFNGVQDANTAAGTVIFDGNTVLRIGAHPNNKQYFDGLIDRAVILDRALSAAEVLADYQSPYAFFQKPFDWGWLGTIIARRIFMVH